MDTAVKKPIKFTYEDYLHFPEDKRYEIIDGEVHMVPSPVPYHQMVLGNLYLRLCEFVDKKGIGEVYFAPLDVVFSEIDVVQPDIMFISKERLNIITEEIFRVPLTLLLKLSYLLLNIEIGS